MGKRTNEMAENRVSVSANVGSSFGHGQEPSNEEAGMDLNTTDEKAYGYKKFAELYEESLRRIHEGEVVKGEIVQIDQECVLVDIGYKSEGQIPVAEFIDSDGGYTARVGDKIDVFLEQRENRDGLVVLSRKKAANIKIWNEIEETYKKSATIRGKIISPVKGGFSVDIGLRAFLPGSQVDMKPVRDMDALLGTEEDFKILRCNKRQQNVVVSRRAILEAERLTLRKKMLEGLEKDAVFSAIVKNITDYGLFVDIGGINGLVHISNMSWGRVRRPSEMYQIGDEVTVKVLNIDRNRERVSLGIKQLTPDPWTKAEDKYQVGKRFKGRVVGLKDYGAFVELEEGLKGLVHVTEMSWSKKIRHPSEIMKIGDIADVMVLNIEAARKRIDLGMKQVIQNPWDTITENYPIGTIVDGKVKDITSFGIFVGIEEGIDGLVHISNISWNKWIEHPSELYELGQEIQALVLYIDKENGRFSLGIKQLLPRSEIGRRRSYA